MTKISDLSVNLVGEILSRVPLTSLVPVRSTCKPWNALSKTLILGQKASSKKKKLEFMIYSSRVCSLSFKDDFLNPTMTQLSIFEEIKVYEVVHCDGLLLCVGDDNKLIIWNPYLGQTKLIKPRTKFNRYDEFALGFDHKNGNHKILRSEKGKPRFDPYYSESDSCLDLYDFESDSWRLLDDDVSVESSEISYQNGVHLKGNVYFFDKEVTTVATETEQLRMVTNIVDYLVCFDFTTERFGPRLPLPFNPPYPTDDMMNLTWVKDEKLSMFNFLDSDDIYEIIEIWVTNEIEPDSVSWSKFLKFDLSGLPYDFSEYFQPTSFFIDEEKKVAVVFDGDTYKSTKSSAYIIGENGYFKCVDTGDAPSRDHAIVSSSYVPSLVQL